MTKTQAEQTGVYKWEYSGPKLATKQPIMTSPNYLMDEGTFIINTSTPIRNKKTKGPIVLYKYNECAILDYQLDVISAICKDPQIIYVTGFEANKIIKNKRRDEFISVENQLYQHTNSAIDLRLGINASCKQYIFWIDGRLIPTIETFEIAFRNGKQSTTIYKEENSMELGLKCNRYNIVIGWSYGTEIKTKGLYFINKEDTARLKRKSASNAILDNQFDFELLNEAKILAVKDTSNSILADDNNENIN